MKTHVASNISSYNQIIPAEHLKTQTYLHHISEWTKNQKMELNCDKTKSIIFNFTRNYQFSTQLSIENDQIEVISETKLLGTIINNTLSWDSNTDYLVKKAFSRMQLLYKMSEFHASIEDMKTIYIIFIRSLIEQSCPVWHSSLTKENSEAIERVQKCAVRCILQGRYQSYRQALEFLQIPTCKDRRIALNLSFARKCLDNPKMKHLFPTNESSCMLTRNREKYKVFQANTERLASSSILYMQSLLNRAEK